MSQQKHFNRLAEETSPYLLQHASNPVDWYPWGPEALKKAELDEKPIILSIGYSACHWCHVMERESFESDSIAQEMNQNYVCIKVDREERPDLDQIYMDAIHAMGVQGGWPLNLFLTPDQKPFYGGTYFPPDQWVRLIQQISLAFNKNRAQLESSADQFVEALTRNEAPLQKLDPGLDLPSRMDMESTFKKLSQSFDTELGGTAGAPKFPMPVNGEFSIDYFKLTQDRQALDQLNLTLESMALGGIYDQIGGGFARYSVDERWFAPHFEKMLYDNGQLVSLYSAAYKLSPNPLFATIVEETIDFVQRELMSSEGGFFSALDADSEGREGKYYVWSYTEVREIMGSDFEIFEQYYNVQAGGNWEDGQNILHINDPPDEFARKSELTLEAFITRLKHVKSVLLEARSSRVRPGLDDKILAGWNGLMLKGLCDAYATFGSERFLELAITSASFLKQKMISDQGIYRSYKNSQSKLPGYLEDLAAVSLAMTLLYQITFEEQWLKLATKLVEFAMAEFYDQKDGLFFFTGTRSENLIARKKELFDNVIPSSNSVMAQVLLQLGTITDNSGYIRTAENMISRMAHLTKEHPGSLAKWASLMTQIVSPNYEIAIVGPNAVSLLKQLRPKIEAQAVYLGTTSKSEISLLRDKVPRKGQTLIYVCKDRTCKLPVTSVEDALTQID